MGAQDVDLLQRFAALSRDPQLRIKWGQMKYKKVHDSTLSQAIKNSKTAKVSNCDPQLRLRWCQMDARNRESFRKTV